MNADFEELLSASIREIRGFIHCGFGVTSGFANNFSSTATFLLISVNVRVQAL
jgi:hypothetical protein